MMSFVMIINLTWFLIRVIFLITFEIVSVAMFVILFFAIIQSVIGDFDPSQHYNWKLLDNDVCGDSTASRIIGGTKAQLGEFPWIARLGYISPDSSELSFKCGAAILTKRTILTAAHCVTDLPSGYRLAKIVLGELDDKSNPDCENFVCAPPIVTVEPWEVIFHEEYPRTPFQNDIALIRVAEDIQFSAYVRPICLPKGSLLTETFVGKTPEVAGWGITDIQTDEMSNVMLKVSLDVQENQICKVQFEKIAPVGEKQMCAGGKVGQDSCGGDSGGPLMLVAAENGPPKVYIIGIVSYGTKRCGATTAPGIYTRITSYLEWILDNLAESRSNFKRVF